MQIVKYEIIDNILTVGFKEDNFVVYSSIAYDESKNKNELLQQAYKQIKHTIDYERTLDKHSFTTEEEGEVFVPEAPRANEIKLSVDTYHIQFEELQETANVILLTEIKDQYGDDYTGNINFTTTYGTIEDNILTVPKVTEYTEVIVSAEINGITDTITIQVYPYAKPQIVDEFIDEEKIAIAEAIIDLDARISTIEGRK